MDFFKSLLSEPSPPSSPTDPRNSDASPPPSPPPQSSSSSSSSSASFFTAIASKSDSFLQSYYKDLKELTAAFKEETSIISRAVQDLPSRLDSGAAIAQNSLEALGQAVDNLGSTLINTGKELNFTQNYGSLLAHLDKDHGDDGSRRDLNNLSGEGGSERPYSRLEALIRGLQCSLSTYCDDVEDDGKARYDEWRTGFRVEDKREEIELLIAQNHVVKEIYDEIVPSNVDEETFWSRYFYKAGKVIEAEEARTRLLNRAISGEDDEELSWDVGEDEGGEDNEPKHEVEEIANRVGILKVEDSDRGDDERSMNNERGSSDGKVGSDFSVISSHRSSSHNEDDLGWDEIEDIGNGDDKVNVVAVKKRLSFPEEEEEEDLSWDVEDDD